MAKILPRRLRHRSRVLVGGGLIVLSVSLMVELPFSGEYQSGFATKYLKADFDFLIYC